MQEDKNVINSAVYISLGTLSSRVLGFVRDMLMASYFSRTVTDAWLVAFRIPNLFRRIFGEGALSISFIPIFVQILANPAKKDQGQDRKLVAGMFTFLCLILLSLTLLGIIFSEQIIWLIAGENSFLSVPGKFKLTVEMAQIMFCFCFFICLYAYFAAILNAFKKFVVVAFAPALLNVAMITAILLAAHIPWQFSSKTLAWGVAIGGFLQMAILLPALFREKILLRFTRNILDQNVLLVLKKMLPGILGLGAMQLGLIINTRFASSLEEGANSWIFWSDRILELPLSLFAVSLGTAMLPTLSEYWANSQKKEMIQASNKYLRMIFILAVPCAVGLWCLSSPIVEVLFERGKFGEHDLVNTALVLQIYSVGLLFFAGIRVIAPSFYAVQNTFFPAAVATVCLCVHFFLARYLMVRWGIAGLASSSMICAGLNFLFLLIGFRMMIGSLQLMDFFKSFWKYSVAAFVMYFVITSFESHIRMFHDKAFWLLTVILLGAASYFYVLWRLRSEEFFVLIEKFYFRLRH